MTGLVLVVIVVKMMGLLVADNVVKIKDLVVVVYMVK